MKTLMLHDKDTFYAPASDDCWVRLAQAMMSFYSKDYSIQYVVFAKSQKEYDALDSKKYAPARRSILKSIKHGPLGSIVNIYSVYCALENQRIANMQSGVNVWEDTFMVDLDSL